MDKTITLSGRPEDVEYVYHRISFLAFGENVDVKIVESKKTVVTDSSTVPAKKTTGEKE
jgi:hypothetical protein